MRIPGHSVLIPKVGSAQVTKDQQVITVMVLLWIFERLPCTLPTLKIIYIRASANYEICSVHRSVDPFIHLYF